MAKINDLAGEITKALKDYSEDVEESLETAKKAISKEAVSKLKSARTYHVRSGKYNAGWTVKKVGTSYVVYNSKAPGLTHLLEQGHAKRNGGRVRAFPHIAPVDDYVAEKFEEEVRKEIGR